MMKIKALMNITYKVNGVRMGPYSKDAEYDLSEADAQLLIGSGMAEEVVPLPPPPVEPDEDFAAPDAAPAPAPQLFRRAGRH